MACEKGSKCIHHCTHVPGLFIGIERTEALHCRGPGTQRKRSWMLSRQLLRQLTPKHRRWQKLARAVWMLPKPRLQRHSNGQRRSTMSWRPSSRSSWGWGSLRRVDRCDQVTAHVGMTRCLTPCTGSWKFCFGGSTRMCSFTHCGV